MSNVQLKRVKEYYDHQGFHINSETIEKCLLSTAELYNLSSEEVYSVISPYFHTYAANTPQSEKNIVDDTIEKVDALTYSSDDFTDINVDYNKDVDDQKSNVVKFDDQEYLSIDFTKKVVFRFPIFDENSYIPPHFGKQKYYQIQKYIRESLPTLQHSNWTNQTLSYARSNIVGKHIIECIVLPLYRKGMFPKPMKFVDATGNIGADSILFAMEKFVESVDVYEILPQVYRMLVNNIHLYGMDKKIHPHNKRFGYDVPEGALVMIDPPYEADNNKGNFNLSIDRMPIYYVAQRLLEKGAACVILSMPKTYKYNTRFAIDNHQHVSVYQMGKINNKMFLITTRERAEHCGLIDFNYTLVTTDETQKMWNGKVNAYKCKSESKYGNFANNTNEEYLDKWKLVLPKDAYKKDKDGNVVINKDVKSVINDIMNEL